MDRHDRVVTQISGEREEKRRNKGLMRNLEREQKEKWVNYISKQGIFGRLKAANTSKSERRKGSGLENNEPSGQRCAVFIRRGFTLAPLSSDKAGKKR